MREYFAVLLACLCFATDAPAQTNKVAKEAELFKRPGVIADPNRGQVLIAGRATGLHSEELVEFFVILEKSDHDYEAAIVAEASATDIRDAMLHLGFEPGRPPSPQNNQFYASGETVIISLAEGTPEDHSPPLRAEDYLLKENEDEDAQAQGFVFTGSLMLPDPDDRAKLGVGADLYQPHSLISAFSDPLALFVIPGWVPQGEVYGQQKLNPDYVFGKDDPVTIIIEAEENSGGDRIRSVKLSVKASHTDAGESALAGLECAVSTEDKVLNEEKDLGGALGSLVELSHNGVSPMVKLSLDDGLPLQKLRTLAKVFFIAEQIQGIRIGAQEEGHLYYRAFSPDEGNRKREDRIAQPLELGLTQGTNGLSGALTYITATYEDTGSLVPTLTTKDVAVPTSSALRAQLDKDPTKMPVLLVFAQPSLTYGELRSFIGPALKTHPIVHVYMEEAPVISDQ